MLDYLDAIISQSKEAAPLLRPRTLALFEPAPNGYGPDDRFRLSLRFHETSRQEPFGEQSENPIHPTESSRNTVQTVYEVASKKESSAGADHLSEKIQRQSNVSRSDVRKNVFAGEPLLKPVSSVAIPSRLDELDVMTEKTRSAPRLTPPGQTPTSKHPLQSPSIVNPVSINDTAASLIPHLSGVTQSAAPKELSELPDIADSNELAEGVFSQRRNVDSLKQMDEKSETLRPKPIDSPMMQSTRAPFLPSNLSSQPEQGRSMLNVVPLHIHVNIRQVEVRATATPPPPQPSARRGATPTSLEDYLQRMNGGSR